MESRTMVSEWKIPDLDSAPSEIRNLDNDCGPLSMWIALSALNFSCAPETILKACRFTGEGMWTVALGIAFNEFGFHVEIRSDTSAWRECTIEEQNLIEKAKNQGIEILPGIPLPELLSIPGFHIIAYRMIDGSFHFSPVIPFSNRSVRLLLDDIELQAMNVVETQRDRADRESISIYAKIP